jgi:hypothetical protein
VHVDTDRSKISYDDHSAIGKGDWDVTIMIKLCS